MPCTLPSHLHHPHNTLGWLYPPTYRTTPETTFTIAILRCETVCYYCNERYEIFEIDGLVLHLRYGACLGRVWGDVLCWFEAGGESEEGEELAGRLMVRGKGRGGAEMRKEVLVEKEEMSDEGMVLGQKEDVAQRTAAYQALRGISDAMAEALTMLDLILLISLIWTRLEELADEKMKEEFLVEFEEDIVTMRRFWEDLLAMVEDGRERFPGAFAALERADVVLPVTTNALVAFEGGTFYERLVECAGWVVHEALPRRQGKEGVVTEEVDWEEFIDWGQD